MGYVIRRAMPSDAATLTDCITAAYADYVRQGIDLPPVSEGVLMDIRDNVVRVAADGTHILGGVILSVRGETADLMNIAVHPGAAGRGVGRALMAAALEVARAAGHTDHGACHPSRPAPKRGALRASGVESHPAGRGEGPYGLRFIASYERPRTSTISRRRAAAPDRRRRFHPNAPDSFRSVTQPPPGSTWNRSDWRPRSETCA